jgi:hypothetical protein
MAKLKKKKGEGKRSDTYVLKTVKIKMLKHSPQENYLRLKDLVTTGILMEWCICFANFVYPFLVLL